MLYIWVRTPRQLVFKPIGANMHKPVKSPMVNRDRYSFRKLLRGLKK